MTAHVLATLLGVALLAIGVIGLAAYLAQTSGHDLVAHALSETGIQNAARTADPRQPSVRAQERRMCFQRGHVYTDWARTDTAWICARCGDERELIAAVGDEAEQYLRNSA